MGDPTALLVKEIELANKLRDASQALPSNATQSQQDAEVQRLTSLCQALIGEAFAAPEEATGIFALAGLSIGMAAAAQEEQNCKNASQSLVAEFDSSFNSAETSLATDESSYHLNNSQASDFSNLNENSNSGNINGAISVSNQLLVDSQFVGVTDNSTGITYQDAGLDVALSTNWQPIKLDQENSNGTSQITIYNPDGSSTSTYYSGANGTGSVTELDQENSDGTSQITIPGNSSTDTPTITTYYSGSNGTGTITKTDQENPNGTSQITIYAPDGSSTSTYYSGANGTGSVTETDQENANGTSTITTFNPDGSSTSVTYNGQNGNGVITSATVNDAYGDSTTSTTYANYAYASSELYTSPPDSSAVGTYTGTITIGVLPGGTGTEGTDALDFNIFGTNIANLYYANVITLIGGSISEWFVSELSPDRLYGFVTVNYPSSGDNPYEDAESPSVEGGNNVSGTWSFAGYSTVTAITPNAGQTEQLADALSDPNLAPQNAMENVTIGGAGVVELMGTASIPFVLVTSSGSLLLKGGVLSTDPITIDGDGNISGNGTVTGAETNYGTITADGGTLDLTGDITGMGTLMIDADAALQLEGTVAATESLSFSGSNAALIIGTTSSVLPAIMGFDTGDFIEIEGLSVTAAAYSSVTDELTLTASNGTAFTLSLSGTYQPSDFVVSDGKVVDHALCFLEGTRIRTPGGEIPIEQLKIGDLVMTGASDAKPIKWIGMRAYDGLFIAGNHLALPVCIKQNAIAGRVPARDLDLSPGHGVFFDGVLVPAWRLVNGVSITQAKSVPSVRYINVELESHEVILANNCPAETFLNIGNFREQFQNADEFKKLYPDDDGEQRASIPRLEEGFKLHAIQSYLAGRAGVAMPTEGQGDMVHGFVDEAGPARVRGWVQCVDKPEAPVTVDIWVGGRLVARSLANGYRADLRKAGLGSGCHGFDIPMPAGLSGPVRVRRAVDQTEIVLTDAAEQRAA